MKMKFSSIFISFYSYHSFHSHHATKQPQKVWSKSWEDKYVVYLKNRTYTCGSWDITCIPYIHATGLIVFKLQLITM